MRTKGYVLYVLRIDADENQAAGAEYDEWFTSLATALRRRAELIERNPTEENQRVRESYAIDKVELYKLPPKDLLLLVLNRDRRFIRSSTNVVLSYVFQPSR